MAPLWLLPAVLSLATATLSQDGQHVGNPGSVSCGAPPVRQVVCYWEDAAPLTSLDACMCSQVIFTRGSEYASDNTTLQLLPEVRAATEILRRRNPDLRTLVRVPVSSTDAKSPVRRQRLADNIQSMVRKGALNGAELVLEEQKEETKVIVPRAALTATLQVIRVQLDTLASHIESRAHKSSLLKSRRRRSYDVTERQVEDEPPATWRPLLRRSRPRQLADADVATAASTTSTAATTAAVNHGKTTVSLSTEADTTEPTVQDEMATESTESLASYTFSKKISSSTSTASTSVGTTASPTTAGSSTGSDASTTSTSTTAGKSTTSGTSTTRMDNTDGTTIDDDEITVNTDETEETDPETEGTAATAPMSSTASTTKVPVTPSSTTTTTATTPSTPSASASSETRPSRRTTRAFADDYQDDYSDDDQYWNSEDDESDEEQAQLDDDEVITASEMPSVLLLLRLPAKPDRIAKHYDLKSLSKIVDWFTLPTHNMTDPSESGQAFHPSRLMGLSDTLNTDSLVDLVTSMGVPTEKIIVSVPSFALKFTLADASENTPRSAVIAPPAKLDRDELCSMLAIGNWTLERDEDLTAPYAFRQDSWIAFEDDTSIGIKAKYIVLRSLGGVALETADGDAWRGDSTAETSHDTCSNNGGRLLPALYQRLSQVSRQRRGAVLADLQNEISQASTSSVYAEGVHSSPYRIVRLVDRQGDVHAIRENTQVEFECSRQGYFSHPRGCNRFYRCVKFNQLVDDYTVFEFDCPPGLAFDEKVEVCVWPGSLRDGGACTGSSEIAPVPRSRFVCPSVEGFYADPENCRWFFACMDHARDGLTPLTAYEFRCPFGLVFDAETLLCDWPWRVVSCGGGRAGLVTFNSAGISVYNGASSADSAAFLRSAGGAYANDVGGFGHRLNGDSNAFAVNAGLQGGVSLHSLGLTAPGVASYSIGDDASGSNLYSTGARAPLSGSARGSTSEIGTISGLSLLSPDDDSPADAHGGFAHSSGPSNGGFAYSTVVKGNNDYQSRGNFNGYASTVNNGISLGQATYAASPAISSSSFQQAGYIEGRSNSFSLDEASNVDGSYVQSVTPLPAAPVLATGISYEVNKGLSGEARFASGGAAVSIHSTPSNEYLPVTTPSSATATYTNSVRYATSTPQPVVQTVSHGPAAVLEHSSLYGHSQPRDFQSVVGVYNSPVSAVSSFTTTVSPVRGYTYNSTPAPVTRAEFAYSSTPATVTVSSTPATVTVSSTPATVSHYSAPEYLPPRESTDTVEYRSPQISTVQPVQTYQQVQSVTAKPAVVYQESYQAQQVQPIRYQYTRPAVSAYQQVQTVTSRPEVVQHVSTAQPALPTVTTQHAQEYLPPRVSTVEYRTPQISTVQPVQTYQQVHTVTAKPAVVYQERYQAQQVQPIQYQYTRPAVSTYQQVQTVTSRPEIVEHVSTAQPALPTVQPQRAQEYLPPRVSTVEYRAPQISTVHPVQSYQQVQSVTSKPAVVYQESYQAQHIQQVNYDNIRPAVSTYQQVEEVTSKPQIYQPVQTVSTIQPVLPTVQSYQQVQPVTAKPTFYQQVYEYTRPTVSTYQQIQTITSKPEIVQPVQPISVEYRSPAVSVNEQVQTVTSKPEILQEVPLPPVQPVSYGLKNSVGSSFQQVNLKTSSVQEVEQLQPVQPAISYEYKSPAVAVQQQVQAVPVQPQVHHEYRQPVVHQQTQFVQGGEQYKAALKYQEVQQINSVAQPEPAVYQVNQPQANVQLASPTPFVHTYQQQNSFAPTFKAQEVVYDYNAPSSVPIRQKETHTVELPNIQYQTYQQVNEVANVAPVTPAPAVSYKSTLYPFVNTQSRGYVQNVHSTAAPVQYTTVDQGSSVQYTSSGASVQYSSSGATQYSGISSTTPVSVTKVSQPAQVSFVSSTPASVEISNDGGSGAYNTAFVKECLTCGSSTANLRVSTTPTATVPTTAAPQTGYQFSYQSPGISSQPQFVDVQGYYAQNRTDYRHSAGFANLAENSLPQDGSALYFLQPQTLGQRPDRLDLTYYSTPRPAVSSVDKTTYTVSPAPQKIYVDEPSPEISYQAEAPRSTLRPIVVADVTTAQPPVYRETYSTKVNPTVIRTELKQEIPFNQQYLQPELPRTQITYGARTKPKVISEFNYVADGVQTVSTPASVDVESYHSTSEQSIDVYPTARPTVPSRRLRPTAVPVSQVDFAQNSYGQVQQQYAANYGSTDEQYLAGLVSQGISDGFGTKSGASAGISSTSYVTGSEGQYTGAQGEYDENGFVRNTLRAKPKEGRKKTKIVIVTRLTDVNPLLVGKLGAQCSCARRRLNLKGRRPGLRKVVRIIRPSTSGDVYSSTTPGYVEVSSSTEKSSEFEEDLALINDAEREDEEYGPSSTTAAPFSSTTVASRGSRYRGRGSYYQAGKAKSTIYVSSTEEPEHEEDDDYNGDEELSPVQEDENAVQIPSRGTQSRRGLSVTSERRGQSVKSSSSSNAVPSSSQTVDLGSQGTVECQRPGLFRHPQLCNKFYSCNWDSWKKKYVVNVFNCPIHLAYDSSLGACNWPSKGPACVNGKLLV